MCDLSVNLTGLAGLCFFWGFYIKHQEAGLAYRVGRVSCLAISNGQTGTPHDVQGADRIVADKNALEMLATTRIADICTIAGFLFLALSLIVPNPRDEGRKITRILDRLMNKLDSAGGNDE